MNNLPAKLNRDKKSLRTKFNELKAQEKKPKWFYDKTKGECCIKVGGKKIYPQTDNFDFKFVEPEEDTKVDNVWSVSGTADNEEEQDDA